MNGILEKYWRDYDVFTWHDEEMGDFLKSIASFADSLDMSIQA